MTSPSIIDLSKEQGTAIYEWARKTPAILAVYLFGSRAKGTSNPNSDLDLAVAVATTPGLTNKASYDERWLGWSGDIEERVGLNVHLLRLHATETPNTLAGVNEAGILLYNRDADRFHRRIERNDLAVAKRLEADRLEHRSLVPLSEAADLYVVEAQTKDAHDTTLGGQARRQFYNRLMEAVRQREFEKTKRLFVINGSVIRLDRRAQALLSGPPGEISDELIASHWAKTWASRSAASAWCRRHGFSVPARWTAASSPQTKTGRPDKTEGVLKEYARRRAAGCVEATVEAESKHLEAWARRNLPGGQHPAARTISKRISKVKTTTRK